MPSSEQPCALSMAGLPHRWVRLNRPPRVRFLTTERTNNTCATYFYCPPHIRSPPSPLRLRICQNTALTETGQYLRLTGFLTYEPIACYLDHLSGNVREFLDKWRGLPPSTTILRLGGLHPHSPARARMAAYSYRLRSAGRSPLVSGTRMTGGPPIRVVPDACFGGIAADSPTRSCLTGSGPNRLSFP